MREYTFTTDDGHQSENYYEFYDKRHAKKEALKQAKIHNKRISVICMHKPSYKQDWFYAYPDGRFITDAVNIKFDN